MTTATARPVRAPRGTTLSCKGWPQEAALRMLMNNLDPDVAEHPDRLIVYGGSGRAARSWDCFDAIVRSLKQLGHDETLLVQSGKPVGVFRTHSGAPRVLIANALIVPAWATFDNFRDLEDRGDDVRTDDRRSWIYIGTEAFCRGTWRHWRRGTTALQRRPVRTPVRVGGVGRHGRGPASGGHHEWRGGAGDRSGSLAHRRRLATRYVDEATDSLDDAVARVARWKRGPRAARWRCVPTPPTSLPALLARGVVPDVLTDQTSAHDPLNGYVPNGMSLSEAIDLRQRDPAAYITRSVAAMAGHVRAMLELRQQGAVTFDYGNNLRAQAVKGGVVNAFDIPGFVPSSIRPLFCEGKGPFRWAALSGDPADIHATDQAALEMFADNAPLCRWIRMASNACGLSGPAGSHFLARYGERARFG